MAQKNNNGSGSRSVNKPTTTARKPGQSGNSRSQTSKNGSTAKGRAPAQGAERSGSSRGNRSSRSSSQAPAPNPTPAPVSSAVRRELWGAVLLLLAFLSALCYFPIEAWFVSGLRKLCLGLWGYGFYLVCPSFLLGALILFFHNKKPVRGRLICLCFLPLLLGAFVHIVFGGWAGDLSKDFIAGVKDLWNSGLLMQSRCGGVLSGLLAEGLELSISIYGGAPLLAVLFLALLAAAMWPLLSRIHRAIQDRPRIVYLPELEYMDGPEDPNAVYAPSREEREKLSHGAFQRVMPEETPVSAPSSASRRRNSEDLSGERMAASWGPETAGESQSRRKKSEKSARPEFFDAKKEDELFEAVVRAKVAKAETAAPKTGPSRHKEVEAMMAEVEPMSVEEAAEIAGVQLESTAMDGPAAAKSGKLKIDKDAEAAKVAAEIEAAEEKTEYNYPPLRLLKKGKAAKDDGRDETNANWKRLESTLHSFGVSARIVGVTRGPTVTRFDLELAQGVKLSKITNLAGDIALTLGVKSVRISPVPDQASTVGVEVPNRKTTMVMLRDIIESENFQKASSCLSFAVGRDIAGNAVVGNIEKLPHLLVAGTTGSGKSVFINSLILSLLYKSTPDEVRLIMIDPKMVELGIYNGMPHLYVPVVTDPKKAAGALQWSVVEMLKRYNLFKDAGVRDMEGYNNYQRRHGGKTLPRVVIIIDELADLMMVASKEVEDSIVRVAQMGRASGMHLVVATQRPSADVITGLIKSNVPGRAAFTVASAMESRIIMDAAGAEKLLGNGDLIYSPKADGRIRVQSAFVSDEEREDIVNFIKKDAEASYSDEIMEEIERAAAEKKDKGSKGASADSGDEGSLDGFDELLPQAVDVVLDMKHASTSSLQRRLKLGYSRAARIMDQMEELGVVGPSEGSKPRKLLITRSQWQEMQYGTGVAPADRIIPEEDDIDFAALPENSEDEEF